MCWCLLINVIKALIAKVTNLQNFKCSLMQNLCYILFVVLLYVLSVWQKVPKNSARGKNLHKHPLFTLALNASPQSGTCSSLQAVACFQGAADRTAYGIFLKNIIAVLRLDVPRTMASKQQGFPLWFWHCRFLFDITIVRAKIRDICQWIFIARVISRQRRKGSVGRHSEQPSNACKQGTLCLSAVNVAIKRVK
jgi:hypothetical protein